MYICLFVGLCSVQTNTLLQVVFEIQKEELSDKESHLMVKIKENQALQEKNSLLLKHYTNLKEQNKTITADLDSVS